MTNTEDKDMCFFFSCRVVFGRTGRQVLRAALGHGWRHLWFDRTHRGEIDNILGVSMG